MIQERQATQERSSFVWRGGAAVALLAGVDILIHTKTAADLLIGAGLLFVSKYAWDHGAPQTSHSALA